MRKLLVVAMGGMIAVFQSCGENEGGGSGIGNSKPLSFPAFNAPPLESTGKNAPVFQNKNPMMSSGLAKLNPAHGQPGHRCDIAVGSPLPLETGAGIGAQPISLKNESETLNAQPLATPAVTKPGLNPAHGQPGHRCDIAVGEPLDSRPASNQPASSSNTSTNVTPLINAPATPDTLFAKGLNPAHGQPGHRCDIAVGQPLNKPAQNDTSGNQAKANP